MKHLKTKIRTQIHIQHTLGLELPAKPALMLEVPASMTTGWFNSNDAPTSPSTGVSSEAMATIASRSQVVYNKCNNKEPHTEVMEVTCNYSEGSQSLSFTMAASRE